MANGNDWAVKVEQWRQANPGRALTDKQRARLREMRGEQKLTAADEADAQAIVAAYTEAYRRIIADPEFVPLTGHHTDAAAILPDARRLADRGKRGGWRPTPAEVVAHRLESYLREPKNRPTFRLRWIFDRTEQDDLPRPPKVPKPKAPEQPGGPMPAMELGRLADVLPGIGARRGPVLKPTPPPADVAGKIAEFTRYGGGDEKGNRSG